MNKTLRRAAILVCLLLFIGSSAMFLRSHIDYARSGSSHDAARDLADSQTSQELPDPLPPLEETPRETVVVQLPDYPEEAEEGTDSAAWQEAPVLDDPYMESLREINLTALREVNPDVIGWITIPDTELDYPIMRGEDNQYYLEHTWDRQPNSAGSIFLECQNSADLSDFNTIIYGHRMKDGSMFASLKYYKTEEHRNRHPYVYIVDDNGVHRYEIFAAYEAGIKTYTYCIGFTEERKAAFLESCLERSVINTGITPTINDRILTLSTCTGTGYDTRWVVQARLAAAE